LAEAKEKGNLYRAGLKSFRAIEFTIASNKVS
jgi:hypothetical protein